MKKEDIILIGGIIIAIIWLMTYILFEDDKKRKIILAIGVVIDIILYLIGKNTDLLLVGIVGGIIGSFIPARSTRRYKNAIKETRGFMNYMLVFVVFTVMIFMIAAIACPGVEFSWK